VPIKGLNPRRKSAGFTLAMFICSFVCSFVCRSADGRGRSLAGPVRPVHDILMAVWA